MEATSLRDRLEDERAVRIKEIMERQKIRLQEAEKTVEPEDFITTREEPAAEKMPEADGALAENKPVEEKTPVETIAEMGRGDRVEKGEKEPEVAGFRGLSSEFEKAEVDSGHEKAWKPDPGPVQEKMKEEQETAVAPEVHVREDEEGMAEREDTALEENPDEDSEAREDMDAPLDKVEDLSPVERRPVLRPVLLIILLIVVLSGAGGYFYNTGQLSSVSGAFRGVVEKIKGLSGKTSVALFDLKNEQEPALDGRFFTVRGMVQNKGNKLIRYVPLRIKIFNGKNKVVLTGQTVAGEVLSAEQISKMSVQDVLEKHRALVALNQKEGGLLGTGEKRPFLFLFDLTRFPRKSAKTFQIEPVKP